MKNNLLLIVATVPVLALGALCVSPAHACAEHALHGKPTIKTSVKASGKLVPKKVILKTAVAKKVATSKVAAKKPVVVASAKKTEIKKNEVPEVLNFKMKSLSEQDVDLSNYQGKVVMMVNVASKCGMTPQYEGLQELHKKYSGLGLAILGFPSNDFGQQEPGTAEEIGEFCKKNYGVEFDMFSKIAVTGENKAPLYKYLTSAETNPEHAGEISWNFEKFLIGRNGKIVARFAPGITPTSAEVTKAIETELAKK